MNAGPVDPPTRRRERSVRHPGVPLTEAVEFCKALEAKGLDRLGAGAIAAGLGYGSIKTNTFSARLSAARQFGLLTLANDGYTLTPLARSILHPVDPGDLPRLHRQAWLDPPLYADLARRLAGKRVPEASTLANLLYHHHQIIASAKLSAAESFLESARFAGALGDDQVLHPQGPPTPSPEAAPDVEHASPGRGRGEAGEPLRGRHAAAVEMVGRRDVLDREGIEVLPGDGQGLEDGRAKAGALPVPTGRISARFLSH